MCVGLLRKPYLKGIIRLVDSSAERVVLVAVDVVADRRWRNDGVYVGDMEADGVGAAGNTGVDAKAFSEFVVSSWVAMTGTNSDGPGVPARMDCDNVTDFDQDAVAARLEDNSNNIEEDDDEDAVTAQMANDEDVVAVVVEIVVEFWHTTERIHW